MCADFFHQRQKDPPESFFKWSIVSDIDYMFIQMSAAEFTGF